MFNLDRCFVALSSALLIGVIVGSVFIFYSLDDESWASPRKIDKIWIGSGFFVNKDGDVVTNYHVIEWCPEVRLQTEKRQTATGHVIASDEEADLALLRTDFNSNIKPYSFSDVDPDITQEVYVAGYPFGTNVLSAVKVNKGIVSSMITALGRETRFIFDAATQVGNSGGPVINTQGAVVGIATAKADRRKILQDFDDAPENISYGIRGSVLREFLKKNNVTFEILKNGTTTDDLPGLIRSSTVLVGCGFVSPT